jgi:hypothetical protein
MHQLGYQRTSGLFRPEAAEHQPHTLVSYAIDVTPSSSPSGEISNPLAGKVFLGDYSLLPLLSPTDVDAGVNKFRRDVQQAVATSSGGDAAATAAAVDEADAQVSWIR